MELLNLLNGPCNECRKENETFKFTVSRLESATECRRLPLLSFLSLPMQRITRMPMLVGKICEKLRKSASEEACPQGVSRCISILQKVPHTCCFLIVTI